MKKKNGKIILCFPHEMYKECDFEELPKKFREFIKEHKKPEPKSGYRGMGVGLTHDDYFFSNIHGKSTYRCFKKCDNFPHFERKLKNLSFQYVKKFIEENNLEVRCPLRRHNLEEDCVSGCLYVSLDYQKYFEKENSSGIEEIDEFFFWAGRNYETLELHYDYNYNCNTQYNSIDDVVIEKIKEEIISLFRKGNREIFANEWKVL